MQAFGHLGVGISEDGACPPLVLWSNRSVRSFAGGL